VLKIRDKIQEEATGGGSYTNEEAQDAIGTILVDSATIDFTYNGGTPSITASVIPNSIDADEINYDNATSGLTATDVQAAIDEVNTSVALFRGWSLYGTGEEGNATVTGAVNLGTVEYRKLYNNLTISGAGVLTLSNRAVFVYDSLDLTAAGANALTATGSNASGSSSVGTPSGDIQIPVYASSSTGGASSTTNGSAASSAQAVRVTILRPTYGGNSGRGGVGGASSPRTGGASTAVSAPVSSYEPLHNPPVDPSISGAWARTNSSPIASDLSFSQAGLSSGATGGGGGAGSGTLAGTSGGGGGGGGGAVIIYAKKILVSSSTPANVITAVGGNGGNSTNATNANTASGGGGGGGMGGLILIVCDEIVATDSTTVVVNALNASGGAGGNAGTANGTATAGAGGYGGAGGRIMLYVRKSNTLYMSYSVDGSANSTVTGGAGGVTRMDLPVT
jgi:hypothetical protein